MSEENFRLDSTHPVFPLRRQNERSRRERASRTLARHGRLLQLVPLLVCARRIANESFPP